MLVTFGIYEMLHYMEWIKSLSENVQRFNISVCVCVCTCAHVRMHVCSVMSNSLWLYGLSARLLRCLALLSMEFSRQECWSGLPFLMTGNLPDLGIEP